MDDMKNVIDNINKSSIQGVTEERRGERLLELSLPALVMGQNASGRQFKETTELQEISAELARFPLKTPIKVGTELKLSLKIPATPLLVYPLYLELSGPVSQVEFNGQKNFLQMVTVELGKKFELRPVVPPTQ